MRKSTHRWVRRPDAVKHVFLSSALLLALWPAEGKSQLEQSEALVYNAEISLQQDKEAACRWLTQAFWQLKDAPDPGHGAKRRLRKRLESLLRRADSKALGRLRRTSQTADSLYKSAQSYREKGWTETAVDLLEQVQALQPGRAREELMQLRRQIAADPNRFLFGHLASAERPYLDAEWQQAAGWLESPPYQAGKRGQSRALIGWQHVVGDADLHAEIGMPDGPGKAAFLFGCKNHGSEFYMVELVHLSPGTEVVLRRWQGGKFRDLGSSDGVLPEEFRTGFLPIDVLIRGVTISVCVGDLPLIRATTQAPVEGKVGFFVSKDTANLEPARFRHLRIAEQ